MSELPLDEPATSEVAPITVETVSASVASTTNNPHNNDGATDAPVATSHFHMPQHESMINDVMTMPTDEVSNEPMPSQTSLPTIEYDESPTKTDSEALLETNQELPAEDSETFSPNDPEIQQDAAERYVACIVHAMLFFFVALAATAAILAMILVSQYGFFAFVVILFLIGIIVGIIMFVDKAMREQAEWKPVRRKIRRWKALATAVVLKEIRDFQLDWNEHLLLTDGSEYNLYDEDEVPNLDVDNAAAAAKDPKPKKKRGGRSALFKVVKPFLKVGGRRRKRRKEKEAATSAATQADDTAENYVPPVV